MWRRRRGVVFRGLPQILAINEGVILRSRANLAHYLGQVGVDALSGKQPMVQLALVLLGELGPVAPDNFHSDEFDIVRARAAVKQAGVPFTGASGAVAGRGKKLLQIQLLVLQLQPAADPPAFLDIAYELLVESARELARLLGGRFRIVRM